VRAASIKISAFPDFLRASWYFSWLLQALAPSLLYAGRLTGLEFIAIALALIWRWLVLSCTGKTADL
jgi:hypothetical protein